MQRLKQANQLLNEFNEITAEQLKMKQEYNQRLQMFSKNLLSEQERKTKGNRKRMKFENARTQSRYMNSPLRTISDQSDTRHNETTNYFFKHFDIEKILTFKCMAAQCNTIRSKKFMLK